MLSALNFVWTMIRSEFWRLNPKWEKIEICGASKAQYKPDYIFVFFIEGLSYIKLYDFTIYYRVTHNNFYLWIRIFLCLCIYVIWVELRKFMCILRFIFCFRRKRQNQDLWQIDLCLYLVQVRPLFCSHLCFLFTCMDRR